MHYHILVASKLRFGFAMSTPKEVMGVCPLTSMNTVVSSRACHTCSCQQQEPFGPCQPGKNSLYTYPTTVRVLTILGQCEVIMAFLLSRKC